MGALGEITDRAPLGDGYGSYDAIGTKTGVCRHQSSTGVGPAWVVELLDPSGGDGRTASGKQDWPSASRT